MSTFGLDDEGFSIKRLQDILAELKDAIQAGFGSDGVTVMTGDESGFGILCGIVSKPIAVRLNGASTFTFQPRNRPSPSNTEYAAPRPVSK